MGGISETIYRAVNWNDPACNCIYLNAFPGQLEAAATNSLRDGTWRAEIRSLVDLKYWENLEKASDGPVLSDDGCWYAIRRLQEREQAVFW